MTIGLFAPLPLAIMIPFMAAQSFAMGQAFGTSFQYGKRKISSMSNQEFNAMDAEQLHKQIQSDIREMIPSMNQSFDRMEKFQSEVVNSIIRGVWETLQGLIPGLISPADNTQTQTSTSLSVLGETGTVTDIRYTRPSTTKFNVNAIIDTIQGIEDAARDYMDWAGITDFELAKDKVREMIKEKNKPREDFTRGFSTLAGGVNLRAPTIRSQNQSLTRIQQVRAAAAQNKIRIQDNIKALAPLIQNKRAEIANLTRFRPVRRTASGPAGIRRNRANAALAAKYSASIARWNAGLKILKNQLLDLLKKLSNAKIQLSNFR